MGTFLKKQRKEPKPDPNVQRVLKVDQIWKMASKVLSSSEVSSTTGFSRFPSSDSSRFSSIDSSMRMSKCFSTELSSNKVSSTTGVYADKVSSISVSGYNKKSEISFNLVTSTT